MQVISNGYCGQAPNPCPDCGDPYCEDWVCPVLLKKIIGSYKAPKKMAKILNG